MNTLVIADKLIASGTPEKQARVQAQIHEEQARETKSVVKEEVARATEGFVTRAELLEVISVLRNEIAEMREDAHEDNAKLREDIAKLREDNAKLRQEMADRDALAAWRAAGLLVAMTGIFSIIVKLL